MLVTIKNKNFSGLIVKETPKEIVLQLKPFYQNIFVSINLLTNMYQYLDIKKISKILEN